MTRILLLIVCCLAALTLPLAAQTNPITNGGFEQVDATGAPVDWELMYPAEVSMADKHSGQRALHLFAAKRPEGDPGLNRAWNLPGNVQAGMIARPKGALSFWYKANSATPADQMGIVIIPMNTRPSEVSGRLFWVIPEQHIGDGQWHRGLFAYDFTGTPGAEWIHVGARLYADNVDLWLDDFEWLPGPIGPAPHASKLELKEVAGQEGQAADVTLTVTNFGDAPLEGATATLTAPSGLTVQQVTVPVESVAPGKEGKALWRVKGERATSGLKLVASLGEGGAGQELGLLLAPKLAGLRFSSDQMAVMKGDKLVVRLLARNSGTSALVTSAARLELPKGLTARLLSEREVVPAGDEDVAATWEVTANASLPLARLKASLSGQDETATTTLAVPETLPPVLGDLGEVYAVERDGALVIGTDKARLVIAKQSAGYGFGALEARTAAGWQRMALLPRMGLIAGKTEQVLFAQTATCSQRGDTARTVLRGTAVVDGVTWQARWELSATRGEDTIGFSVQAAPDRLTSVAAFEGPMLYAGEGLPEREDALLPGLEWLVKGEQSSNSLDIVPEHPDRIRDVPHPYKVTVPAVGMKFGDSAVGLLWDIPTEQPSYEVAGAASLVFSSPNRLEGQPNHLMGLLLPAVGKGLEENTTRATEPLQVAAGQALALDARLLAVGEASDSLVALDRWYDGLFPGPLDFPRGDAAGETAFSLSGYFKDRALWNPEWNLWYSDLILGFSPTAGPATELLFGAKLLGEGPVADEARALAAEVLKGDERSRELALEYRPSTGELSGAARAALGLIASQEADGNWGFSGEKAGEWEGAAPDYKYLGKVGERASGLTADKALRVLEGAALTGKPELLEAGLKALEALKTFRAPRASQVWEVPAHTPDILASAHCADANLWGYKITRDPQWLDEARYWARSGLPFVYVWNPADQPAMMGATIPVFGATGYGLSWFAVAVQWNGIAYANSLFELAEYDDSFPWKRVAENIIVSGMYQQATEGERLAQWPDALNFIEGRPGAHGQTPPCFQPSSVVRGLWRMQGEVLPVRTEVARQGGQSVALRGAAWFRDAQWQGDTLTFELELPRLQPGSIGVFGVERPSAVLLAGRELPEVTDPTAEAGPSWRYYEEGAFIELRLPEPGQWPVEIRGIVARESYLVRTNMDFSFDTDAEGWVAAHDLTPLEYVAGAIATKATGGDPYMVSSALSVPGKPGDVLVIVMSGEGTTGEASVYWGNEIGGMAPERNIGFAYPVDGAFHTARIPIGEHPQWAGHTITELRLDPANGEPLGEVRIESIHLERGD